MSKRLRTILALAAVVGLMTGCSGEEQAAQPGNGAPPVLDREPVPLPIAKPDPARSYSEAPVPPVVLYARSRLRKLAMREGFFADLPEPKPGSVLDLMKAFKTALAEAADKPGRMRPNAAGESYAPSRAEIRATELAMRISVALNGLPDEQVGKAWREAGFEGDSVVFLSFREVTVNVMGTGPVQCLEGLEAKFVVPR